MYLLYQWNIIYLCGVPVESTCGVPAVSLYTVYLFCVSLCGVPVACLRVLPVVSFRGVPIVSTGGDLHALLALPRVLLLLLPEVAPEHGGVNTRHLVLIQQQPLTGGGGGATSTASKYSRHTLFKPFLRGRESGFEIFLRFVMYILWTILNICALVVQK